MTRRPGRSRRARQARTPVREVCARLGLALVLTAGTALPLDAQTAPTFDDPGRAQRVEAMGPVVEEMFRNHQEDEDLPGLAWGVILDGELLLAGGAGHANLEEPIPADPRSVFRIASMSKSFTALAVLQLRDEGRLSLDEPASTYLPELSELEPLTADAPEITVRHLLTHSAGFPEDNPWGDRQLADTDDELMALAAAGPSLSNVPGVAYEYSNLGFALLGQIVQRVSGMEFRDYMRAHVFEPLGMDDTVWEFENAPADRLALGYDRVDGEWVHVPHEHHGAFGAMGGLITTIEDFAAYAALHMDAWPARDGPDDGPLSRGSLREMHQPWRFSGLNPGFTYPSGRECATTRAYAYGLSWTRDCRERVMIAHSGGLPGFGSNWTMLPEVGLAVVSFDNRTYAGTSGINLAVVDTLVIGAGLEPRPVPVSATLEDRMRRLIAFLPDWDGAEDSDLFADNFWRDNRRFDLVGRTQVVFGDAGTVGGIGAMWAPNQLRGSVFLEGTDRDVEVFLTLSPEPEPKIQLVRMRTVEKPRDSPQRDP